MLGIGRRAGPRSAVSDRALLVAALDVGGVMIMIQRYYSGVTLPSRILVVTGGAGFVGANLCLALAERIRAAEVVALDNLKRRGSELTCSRLRAAGVEFVHGDVREPATSGAAPCRCSSMLGRAVGAGRDGLGRRLRRADELVGALNCLEPRRRDGAQVISCRRAASIPSVPQLELDRRTATRFELDASQRSPGVARRDRRGVPARRCRTFYGATKLASELLLTEYADDVGCPR